MPSGEPADGFADQRTLRTGAYADDAKLLARQAIYSFVETPWPSSYGRVAGAIDLTGAEMVVDVGCGNGNDVRDLRRAQHPGTVLGFDLSVGMLATVAPLGVPVVNADAASLPLPAQCADVALAMHMLYHCPDIEATVAELRRVVRPGGVLVASTNSTVHLRELRALWTDCLSEATGESVDPWRSAAERFSLEAGGAILATAWEDVQVQRTDNRLRVPDAEPVVAYVDSTRDLSGQGIIDDVWSAALALLDRRVSEMIEADGPLALTVVKGIFVCR